VFCYLDNKEIVSSKLEQAKALPATSLSSPMKWQYNITDNHMFAWAETDNDTILFEMRIESAGSGKNMQESFDKALEWLKSVEYK
jgi:hypothetical protein